jgi:hypothetical protein
VFVKAFVNFASVKKLRLVDGLIAFPYILQKKTMLQEKVDSTFKDTPPPTYFSSRVELVAESSTGKELEVSQQLFNTDSTTIQHPEIVDKTESPHNGDGEIDTSAQQVIQQTTKDKGERVGVEQVYCVRVAWALPNRILQIEQIVNSSTTQQDTSSQTNSLDQTSQQKAFNQKYQHVEVLNGEGEWVSGYFVHKCLEVANLAGVERKWALSDKCGGKYVFFGEIRLPRGK